MSIPDLIIGFDNLKTGETKEYRARGWQVLIFLFAMWLLLWFLSVVVYIALDAFL